MNTHKRSNVASRENLGCFGEYSRIHPLCSKHCVLRLRCAIQHNYNMRMELLDEILESEGISVTVQ